MIRWSNWFAETFRQQLCEPYDLASRPENQAPFSLRQEGGSIVNRSIWELRQVFLDKAGAEVDVDLNQRAVAYGFETVNFAGFDDEDVAGGAFEGLPVDSPQAAAFADKLDFIIGMAVRAWSFARQRAQ